MGAGRARRASPPPDDPPTLPPASPTEALGWEARVELRLTRLEDAVEDLEASMRDRLDRLLTMAERPSLHERCMAGAGELLGRAIDRLTDPAAIKWTALIILGILALLTGASISGWGVTIGGAVGLTQPPTMP